jgi:voltage-gated sodium channel
MSSTKTLNQRDISTSALQDAPPCTLPSQVTIDEPSNIKKDVTKLTVATTVMASDASEASALFEDLRDNSEVIKASIRKTLTKRAATSVYQLYDEKGVWQKIARHPMFENVTLGVICANAMWMAVDTDWNKYDTLPEAEPIFQIMEHAFCFYFTSELLIRFMSFRNKFDCRKDAWFVFDSCLVMMMVVEDWILLIVAALANTEAKFPLGNASVLRLLRLLRLSRLVRMLRSLPELMVLVTAMVQAIRSVMYVMTLLLLTTYVFAIACTQLSADTDMGKQYFVNVALSMYSLVVYATFLDNLGDFCNTIRAESELVVAVVILFIFVSSMTLMNMLLGVLVEVVGTVSSEEKEDMKKQLVADQIISVADELDENSNGRISCAEFCEILHSTTALRALQKVGVDPEDVVDFVGLIFTNDAGVEIDLSFEAFLEQVFELRAANSATIRDIKFLWSHAMPKVDHWLSEVEHLKEKFARIERKIGSALADVQYLLDTA